MNHYIRIVLFSFLTGFTLGFATAQDTWYKYPGNPVLESGKPGDWDEMILDLSIIKTDSGYHLWYCAGIVNNGSYGGLGYAWSKDGLKFQKYEGNPLLIEGVIDNWGDGFATFDIIRSDTGFIIYYTNFGKDIDRFGICMAWSKDGISWKKFPNSILTPGNKDGWEGLGLSDPGIVFDGKKYHMLYIGVAYNIPKTIRLGYASSLDGINWIKYDGNPVIDIGEPGDFDDRWVLSGDLVYNGTHFESWIIGWNLIRYEGGLATSHDCIHWEKSPLNPIFRIGKLGEWDSHWVGPNQVFHTDTSTIIFYWGYNGIGSGFGYATSSAAEAEKWNKYEVLRPPKKISVNIFNRKEIINLDSLTALLDFASESELVDVLNKLASAYALNDDSLSFAYASKALELSGDLKYAKGRAMALYSLGNSQYVNNRYTDAMAGHLKALWVMDSLGMKHDAAYLMMQIAGIHSFSASHDQAIAYHNQALLYFSELMDTSSMILTLGYLAREFIRTGDTAEAIEMYRMKLAYSLALNNHDFIGSAYSGLGECYAGKSLDTAMFYFSSSLEHREHGNITLTAETYLKIAEIYLKSGPEYIDHAEENYIKAHDVALIPVGEGILQLMVCEGLAMLHLEKEQWAECLKNLDLALYICKMYLSKQNHQIYPSLNDMIENTSLLKEHMEHVHSLYFEYYKKQGDADMALEHFMQATAWKDSIANDQSWRKVAMIQGDFESVRSRNMITILENQNEVANLRVQQTRFYLLALAGFVLILILMGFLLIRQNRIRAEHRNTLLEQKLFRLQMNPHFIFNALAGILNFISRKELDNASAYLTSFSRLLRSTLQGSREEYIALDEEVENLRNYLDLQSIRYIDSFEYDIIVDEQIKEDVILPPMLIQPFAENAVEHGIKHLKHKGHITIRFRKDNELLLCEIEDTGVGRQLSSKINFSIRSNHKSLATQIILDRLDAINRKSRIKSSLRIEDLSSNGNASGTKVFLKLPYLTE